VGIDKPGTLAYGCQKFLQPNATISGNYNVNPKKIVNQLLLNDSLIACSYWHD
jgi:hypothetical protein